MPMRMRRGFLWIIAATVCLVAIVGALRIVRVRRGAAEIPVYPGAREGGGRIRYWPRLISWDDRSSARVQRVFALDEGISVRDVARDAHPALLAKGWYLVLPTDLEGRGDPQVIVWQRDPDERLDLEPLWPLPGMTREQRLYGSVFPAAFLDAPRVIGWSWALGGPRSARPVAEPPLIRRPTPPRIF
jgi:hypothetical protein